MDEFFMSTDEPQQQISAPSFEYTPPTFQDPIALEFNNQSYNNNQFNFAYEAPSSSAPEFNYRPEDNQNQFNDFEQDETTKRIREQEERIQNVLKEKSQREWDDKQKRKEQGKRLLEQFFAKKEDEKLHRASENIQKEAQAKEDYAKLNVQAGWKKVFTNINVRQGERKGTKDANRMREAILHRREDDKK